MLGCVFINFIFYFKLLSLFWTPILKKVPFLNPAQQVRLRKSSVAYLLLVKVMSKKASSTLRTSRAVTHPSTIRALRCLTSEFGRDPVFSTQYGR